MVRMVAQISSRIFIGTTLCRNQDWIDVTIDYTEHAFAAAGDLHQWPIFLHRLIHKFIPSCRIMRARLEDARKILMPAILGRRRIRELAMHQQKDGKKAALEFNLLDAIEASADQGEAYDPVISQLGFSFAAIHTTSDLLGKLMMDLYRNPELIEPLRQEIIQVISEDGWEKTSLYKLKLMDSVLKETQRLQPVSTGKSGLTLVLPAF